MELWETREWGNVKRGQGWVSKDEHLSEEMTCCHLSVICSFVKYTLKNLKGKAMRQSALVHWHKAR